MTDRPILMSAPMILAILAGTKTQTRRVVKPWEPRLMNLRRPVPDDVSYLPDFTCYRSTCPYGQPGDRLWVREAFALEHSVEHDQPLPHADGRPVKRRPDDDIDCVHPAWIQPHYRATDPTPELCYEDGPAGGSEDDFGCRWRPSIHMPRWASRITLEVTGVRVERLQDISEADALAEGVNVHPDHHGKPRDSIYSPVQAYRDLWEQINGPGSWEANPWVWVVEFKRVPPLAQGPEERKQ